MIFITSYPYNSEKHRTVFEHFSKKDDLIFILPNKWRGKDGKIIAADDTNSKLNIIRTPVHFYHSRYPIIKGQLKGYMPATSRILKNLSNKGDILYTANEPNLLVTYLNGRLCDRLGLKHIFFTWQNVTYVSRLNRFKLYLTETLIRKNIALSHGAVVGSQKAKDILMKYAPADFKMGLIPISGVDVERFKPGINSDFRGKYSLGDNIVITFAGMFEERKGIMTIMRAFRGSLSELKNLHLVLVGTGILKNRIQKFITDNNLSKSVTIIDWVAHKDLPGLYSNSDIFIYPSQPHAGWEEQFGYSLLEASSSGLPVISTRSGSIDGVIINNQTGILVEPKNENQLKSAILNLAADVSLRKKMGAAGRDFIINELSHQAVGKKLESFIRSI